MTRESNIKSSLHYIVDTWSMSASFFDFLLFHGIITCLKPSYIVACKISTRTILEISNADGK